MHAIYIVGFLNQCRSFV